MNLALIPLKMTKEYLFPPILKIELTLQPTIGSHRLQWIAEKARSCLSIRASRFFHKALFQGPPSQSSQTGLNNSLGHP